MSESNNSPSRIRNFGDEHEESQMEYNGLMTNSPPSKNCCTWKVASVFLFFVAGGLVLTWTMLPAEDIVAKYIPQFDEPMIAYSGPEAGTDLPSGGNSEDDGVGVGGSGVSIDVDMPPSGDENDESSIVSIPSFMTCPEGGELCCNGNAANCLLRVDQMMFGLVHNSMSTVEGDFTYGANHNMELEKALVAGYRGLNLDVCNCDGVIQFCHNVCNLGERYPDEVFSNTVQFLNDYPSEVVVLVFEASLKTDAIVWDDLYSEMENVDGFVDMIYVHTFGEEWPTMGNLVKQNKRIIVFHFNGGKCDDEPCPPGFQYFYKYAAETQYQSSSLEDLENDEYSCDITRGPRADARPADFFVVNNFVTPPDEGASRTANSKKFLANRLTQCANWNKMRPNFVYLDFWSQGITAQLVQFANQQFAEGLRQ